MQASNAFEPVTKTYKEHPLIDTYNQMLMTYVVIFWCLS